MDGAADDDRSDEPGWSISRDELDAVFGVVGTEFDAEWAVLGGPGVVPVRDRDVKRFYVVKKKANALSDALGAAFQARGFGPEDLPQLCGKVDAQGRVIVVMGAVSEETALRLIAVLEADGDGEAVRPAGGGPGSEGVTIGVELEGREPV